MMTYYVASSEQQPIDGEGRDASRPFLLAVIAAIAFTIGGERIERESAPQSGSRGYGSEMQLSLHYGNRPHEIVLRHPVMHAASPCTLRTAVRLAWLASRLTGWGSLVSRGSFYCGSRINYRHPSHRLMSCRRHCPRLALSTHFHTVLRDENKIYLLIFMRIFV